MKRLSLVVVVALLAMMAVPAAMAQDTTYTLDGDAEIVSPGNASLNAVQLRSDTDSVYGAVEFVVPEGTTFADLTVLSTDYMFEADDSCGGGSPRFQIAVQDSTGTTSGNIFAYIGPPPNFTGCESAVWLNSGDLLEGASLVDTSQLGGSQTDTYDAAVVTYGAYTVTGVSLVVDAGWFFTDDSEQTAHFDNVNVNGVLYPFEDTGDYFTALEASVIELVDDPAVEGRLLATLDRAQSYMDAGNPFFAYLTLLQFVMQVDRYEDRGQIAPEDATTLITQARDIVSQLFGPPAPPPPPPPA
jgi:hypothetical protein